MMPFLEWSKGLEIGDPVIDGEHQHLIHVINDLYDMMEGESAPEKFAELVQKVIDYSLYHFTHEESLFAPTAYPYAEEHKKEHVLLRERLTNLQKKMDSSNQNQTAMEVMILLKEWLIHHVPMVDAKIAPYIKRNAGAA
jgi:hemerythrin